MEVEVAAELVDEARRQGAAADRERARQALLGEAYAQTWLLFSHTAGLLQTYAHELEAAVEPSKLGGVRDTYGRAAVSALQACLTHHEDTEGALRRAGLENVVERCREAAAVLPPSPRTASLPPTLTAQLEATREALGKERDAHLATRTRCDDMRRQAEDAEAQRAIATSGEAAARQHSAALQSELDRVRADMEAQLDAARKDTAAVQRRLDNATDAHQRAVAEAANDHQAAIRWLEADVHTARAAEAAACKRAEEAGSSLEAANDECKRANGTVAQLRVDLETAAKRVAAAEEITPDLEAQLAAKAAEVDALAARVEVAEAAVAAANADKNAAAADAAAAKGSLSRAEGEHKRALHVVQEKLEAVEQQLAGAQARVADLEAAAAEAEAATVGPTDDDQPDSAKIATLQLRVSDLEAELVRLTEERHAESVVHGEQKAAATATESLLNDTIQGLRKKLEDNAAKERETVATLEAQVQAAKDATPPQVYVDKIQELEAELAAAGARASDSELQVKALTEDLATAQSHAASMEADLTAVRSATVTAASVEELKQKDAECDARIQAMEKELKGEEARQQAQLAAMEQRHAASIADLETKLTAFQTAHTHDDAESLAAAEVRRQQDLELADARRVAEVEAASLRQELSTMRSSSTASGDAEVRRLHGLLAHAEANRAEESGMLRQQLDATQVALRRAQLDSESLQHRSLAAEHEVETLRASVGDLRQRLAQSEAAVQFLQHEVVKVNEARRAAAWKAASALRDVETQVATLTSAVMASRGVGGGDAAPPPRSHRS